jgi:hypothetical protein
MTKKIVMLAFALSVCGCLAWAADQTFSGVVSDDHCGAKHSTPSADAAACVEKCVAGGSKYVLVSKGKVYNLDAQDKFKGMGGTRVHVMGTLSDDSITVTSVKAGGGHKKAAEKTS